MSSFGETTAALEGQRGHILDANHHEEGLLPRTAATAGHPLLDPRHQRPRGFGLASLRPRASRWLRVQAFLPHLSAHRLLRVSAPTSTGCPSFSIGTRKALPPAFVGCGFRRLHPVLIHSASSSLTKSTTPMDCFTDFYNFLRLLSSNITPSTRQDTLWLSPHHILTFFFLTKYATSCQLAALTTKTTT